MRLTQGTFSFLPDLTDEQISKQVAYAMGKGWAISIEFADDVHPRNAYWEMWGLPLFDISDAAAVVFEIQSCIRANRNFYVKVNAFDNAKGVESCALSFIVNRPATEPGFRLVRQEGAGRFIRYTLESYTAVSKPEGERY